MKELKPDDDIMKNACSTGISWLQKQEKHDYDHLIEKAIRSRPKERKYFFSEILTYDQLMEYFEYMKELMEFFTAFAPPEDRRSATESFNPAFEEYGIINAGMKQKDLAQSALKISNAIRKACKQHGFSLEPYLKEKLLKILG